MVVWMNETPLEPGRSYMLKHTTSTVPATIAELRYRMNVDTLRSEPADSLALNEIGRVRIETARALAVDAYATNRRTGAFILVDRLTNATVGAGMILERTPAELALERNRRAHDAGTNLRGRASAIAPAQRASRAGQRPFTVWLTGLPRAGKSSIAYALEERLFAAGYHALVLDGENLRRGISSDLGFSAADRVEHTRRAAELVKLLNDEGLVVIAAFVTPTAEMRADAQAIVGADRFLEVHCDAPLDVCESRDTDRLFERARAGEIANVTGIDQAFEAPQHPDVRLDTAGARVEANVERLWKSLAERGWIKPS
jgi:bifunctional enzyme CysN/CysC